MVGLPADRSIAYTGSSVFIADPNSRCRSCNDGWPPCNSANPLRVTPRFSSVRIRSTAIPGTDQQIRSGRRMAPPALLAAESAQPFDSLYYSAAVVGINTSAMIEAAILGKPVLSLMTGDFAGTQEGRCTSGICCPRTADSCAWLQRSTNTRVSLPSDVRSTCDACADATIRAAFSAATRMEKHARRFVDAFERVAAAAAACDRWPFIEIASRGRRAAGDGDARQRSPNRVQRRRHAPRPSRRSQAGTKAMTRLNERRN